jgi:hypothetical protein
LNFPPFLSVRIEEEEMPTRKVTETPVNLILWLRDGGLVSGNVNWTLPWKTRRERKRPEWPQVSVGRTDSKRRLGFAVRMSPKTPWILFTLDRVQVTNLRDHRFGG